MKYILVGPIQSNEEEIKKYTEVVSHLGKCNYSVQVEQCDVLPITRNTLRKVKMKK